MNHLLRSVAPIPESGWELLDTEARERLTVALAARKLVDFSGPLGWEYSATDLGRTDAVAECSQPSGPEKSTSFRAASATVSRSRASVSSNSQPDSGMGAIERRRWFIPAAP